MPESKTTTKKDVATTPESSTDDSNSEISTQEKKPSSQTAKSSSEKNTRSYLVIYEGTISHNRQEYRTGDHIELTDEDAKPLLARGAIKQ